MTSRSLAALLALVLPCLVGCGGDAKTTAPADGKTAAAADVVPASVFVTSAPAGAVSVRTALASAKKGDDIVVRAVVGGRKKPFVDGRAVLVAIDTELKHCPDEEGCPTPWDYCCETKDTLLASTLTVQVVGADGAPLPTSLSGVHGLEELKKIVVAGTVSNADGSLVLDAQSIHVEG